MNPRNTTVHHRDLNHAVSGLLFQTYAGVAKHLSNNGININLPLETIDGDRVRIIAIDTDHRYGLVGEVIDHTTDPATCWLARWDMAGNYCGTTAAVEKHSIRQNVPMPAAAEPPRPTVATHIDEFVKHAEEIRTSPPRRSAIVDAAVAEKINSARTVSAGLAREILEPVHDHGLDDGEFDKAFEAALRGPVNAEPKPAAANTADDEAIIEHAKGTLLRKHNIEPPDWLLPSQLAFVKSISRYYESKSPLARAYGIVGLNAACGRFCWYSTSKEDFPPDREIMIAAEMLQSTNIPFYAIVSPTMRKFWALGADVGGQRANLEVAKARLKPFVDTINNVLGKYGLRFVA